MSASGGIAAGPIAPFFARLATWVGGLSGWRAWLTALLCGAVATLALPPFGMVFCLIPAFVALMWQIDAATKARSAFVIGWLFGSGYFLAGLYWVGIAMTVDFARFWWFLPISVGALSSGLGLFIGFVAWATWRTGFRGPAQAIVFVLLWLFAEWLRSWLLSGFPWNLLGTVWSEVPAMLQLASLTGVWGLSAVSLLAAVSLAGLAWPRAEVPGRLRIVVISWGLLFAVFVFGVLRLADADEDPRGLKVRLVQPSVPQSLKRNPSLAIEHIQGLIDLSLKPGIEEANLVVWPETAVPFNLWHDRQLLHFISRAAPSSGYLVTGALRYQDDGKGFNALHVIAEDGRIVGSYDKVHLVPFGEYTPLNSLFGWMDIAVAGPGLSSGPGLATMALPGLGTASPLICYEVIFPAAVTASNAERPGFLLNLTNDAWFGRSSGPYQHFASAKLRAVEEGLPLIRAANNGISAIVDSYGVIRAALALDEIAVLDGTLPAALPPTLFARLGNWTLPIIAALLALLACTFDRSRRRPRAFPIRSEGYP
ncbi:MAG: apolipoprotein N-acyltransferase [Rhodospirillales bacterium]|nr:apolipoprotein N-acyltransferase [Rhodospirillales bacterium]